MATKHELTIKVKGDSKQAQKAIGKVQEKTKKLQESLKNISTKAAIGFAGLSTGIGVAVNAYKQQEKSVNALNASLKQQGIFTEELSKEYQDLASSIQKKTVFGDEDIIQAQALLQNFAGQNKITKELTESIVDFAAANQVDLKTAFGLVGKSISSNTNALARYGIQIDTTGNSSDKMGAITEALTAKFKGQAAAQAEGLGSLDQLKNSFGDLLEVLGKQFAPMITAVAKNVTEFLDTMGQNEELVKWTGIIIGIGTALTGAIAALGLLLPAITTGVAALGTLATAAGVVWTALTGPVGIAVATVTAGLALLWKAWDSNFLGIADLVSDAWKKIKKTLGALTDGLLGVISGGLEVLSTAWEVFFGDAEDVAEKKSKDINKKVKKGGEERKKITEKNNKELKDSTINTQNDIERQLKDSTDAILAGQTEKNDSLLNSTQTTNDLMYISTEETQDAIKKATLETNKATMDSTVNAQEASSSSVQKNQDNIKDKILTTNNSITIATENSYEKVREAIESETGEAEREVEVKFRDISKTIKEQNAAVKKDMQDSYSAISTTVKDELGIIQAATLSVTARTGNSLIDLADGTKDALVGDDGTFTTMRKAIESVWADINIAFAATWQTVGENFSTFSEGIKTGLTTAFAGFADTIAAQVAAIPAVVSEKLSEEDGALNLVNILLGQIKNTIGNTIDLIAEPGGLLDQLDEAILRQIDLSNLGGSATGITTANTSGASGGTGSTASFEDWASDSWRIAPRIGAGATAPQQRIVIELKDDLMNFIEAKIVEREALGVSSL